MIRNAMSLLARMLLLAPVAIAARADVHIDFGLGLLPPPLYYGPPAVYASPPLSTVQQPGYEIGRLAAQSMLQLLAGERPSAALPAPRLIARESSRARGTA